LIINPKAGGVGLNITAANHIIHYNLEWNPAVEDQATARAYRRGQSKTVFVYRLFYSNTIEEIINEKIERKRELSNLSIVGNNGNADEYDLIKAYKISPI
jgi:SNF2 family DNA or RNA helicase